MCLHFKEVDSFGPVWPHSSKTSHECCHIWHFFTSLHWKHPNFDVNNKINNYLERDWLPLTYESELRSNTFCKHCRMSLQLSQINLSKVNFLLSDGSHRRRPKCIAILICSLQIWLGIRVPSHASRLPGRMSWWGKRNAISFGRPTPCSSRIHYLLIALPLVVHRRINRGCQRHETRNANNHRSDKPIMKEK